MKRVTVYSTSSCYFCVLAKRLLEGRGIPFDEIDVEGDQAKRAWLVEVTGRRTVPQIFIGEEPIGGFVELRALDAAGELQEKLAG